jgi:hypothetical protein
MLIKLTPGKTVFERVDEGNYTQKNVSSEENLNISTRPHYFRFPRVRNRQDRTNNKADMAKRGSKKVLKW